MLDPILKRAFFLWLAMLAVFFLAVGALWALDDATLRAWDAQHQLIKAQMYEDRGNFRRAAVDYKRHLILDDTNFDIAGGYAYALLLSGRTEEGLEFARRAAEVANNDDRFFAQLLLARALLENGRVGPASERYAAVLAERPGSAEAHYGNARVAEEQRRYLDMVEHLNRAADLGDAESWHAWSAERDLIRGQIARIKERIEAGETTPRLLQSVGDQYKALGDWPEAVTWYRRAVEAGPCPPIVHVWLALDEAHAGRATAAREQLNALLETNPRMEPATALLSAITR